MSTGGVPLLADRRHASLPALEMGRRNICTRLEDLSSVPNAWAFSAHGWPGTSMVCGLESLVRCIQG
eukprot:1474111-Amphidinium_carterae.1